MSFRRQNLHSGRRGARNSPPFNGNFASLFPGAFQVVQTDLGLTYGGTPLATAGNTSTTVLTLTGTLPTVPVPILIKSTNSLDIDAGAQFSISYDQGSTFAMTGVTPSAGVPVALTGSATGLSIAWAAGTSVTNDTWNATSSGWADQSGNGNNYAQANAAKQPLIILGLGGKPALSWDGVDDSFVSSLSLPAPGTTPHSVFAVFRQNNWTTNTWLFGNSASGTSIFKASASPLIFGRLNGSGPSNGGAVLGSWVEMELFRSNSASDTYKLGATTTTGSAGNFTTTGSQIGSDSGAAFGTLDLLALAFVRGAVPAATRAAVRLFYGSTVVV